MKDKVEITVDENVCIIPTPQHANVTAYFSTSEMERSHPSVPFINLLSAVIGLNGLGQCNTKDEVKELLGEALLWCFHINFEHSPIAGKRPNCKWFKGEAWSHRGPDRDLAEWKTIMHGVRMKTIALSKTASRFVITPQRVRELTSNTTVIAALTSIVHDTEGPGEDIRALCDMYKLSPRECFEAAVWKRREVLNSAHTRWFGKEFQKKL